MSRYNFTTDALAEEFMDEIAVRMVELFGITEDEAIERINEHWRGQSIAGEDDMIYHEDEDFWAKTIYYGPNKMWWLEDE